MGHVAENLRKIKDEIADTCADCGRDPSDITLVAVSKRIDPDLIVQAYAAGHRDFGENRIQDALVRLSDVPERIGEVPTDGPDALRWHFIGHLQGNKARKAAGAFDLIHAVDSPSLARRIHALEEESGTRQPVLAEVNASGESQKNGLPTDGAVERICELAEILGPSLEGLMTMARFGADETELHRTFADLRGIVEQARGAANLPLPHLSMGMSGDFRPAITEGATIVRIGTAIFGRRPD